MRQLTATPEYDEARARIVGAHERGQDAMESVEWAVHRLDDFGSVCVLMRESSRGPVYLYRSARAAGVPSVAVLFAFDAKGPASGEIFLLDAMVDAG